MIKFLHIVVDDKFPKGVYNDYKKISQFENHCVIFNINKVPLTYVGDIEGINVLSSRKTIKMFLEKEDYDFVFFHSLPADYWPFIQYIPKEKIIIWWGWGYDIYALPYGQKPFIKARLLKPLTKKWMDSLRCHQLKKMLGFIYYPYYSYYKKKIIKRIDFFQPVISMEYQLMKQNKGFNAKEYYRQGVIQKNVCLFAEHDSYGDIMFGNSATETNNHFDVAEIMNRACLNGRTIHVPISYGSKRYQKRLKNKLFIKDANIHFLETMLPKEEYYAILSKCSYFVSGVIRQQSMANINLCIENGIKVFLYKDSMVYKYFEEIGIHIYAIEEIDKDSFCTPLTVEEAKNNSIIMDKEKERRHQVWMDFFNKYNNDEK